MRDLAFLWCRSGMRLAKAVQEWWHSWLFRWQEFQLPQQYARMGRAKAQVGAGATATAIAARSHAPTQGLCSDGRVETGRGG